MVTKAGIIFLLFVGALYTTDAQITGWTTPTITGADGTGTLEFPEDQETGETGTTFAATPTTDTITSYTLSPADTPFSVANTGVLSLETALDYETTTSYTLKITAAGSEGNTGTATITVTITDVNEHDPEFSATYSTCIADQSKQDTTLTTVTATDKDGTGTITYSISSGNTGTAFKMDTNSGLIQVSDGTTLDKATLDSYDLEVTATDTAATVRSATTIVSVTVADSCDSGTAVVVVSMVMLFVSLIVTLY